MRTNGKSTRFNERRKLDVPVEVYYAENSENNWSEDSRCEEVTLCGVGFTLSRPVEPNHIINVRLPMPKPLRLFDYGKELYDVWGLVRSVQLLHASAGSRIRLKVGVALIGEHAPSQFLKDFDTLYDLNPILQHGGFWGFRQLPKNWRRWAGFYDSQQKVDVKIVLQMINENGRIMDSIDARTIKANEGEMVLIADLESECSKFVIIRSVEKNQKHLAKVRNVELLENGKSLRIQVEFLSGEWMV